MAKAFGRVCAQIAVLLTIYGSIQCVKAASEHYDVTHTQLTYIDAHEPVRLSPAALHRQRRAAITPAGTPPPPPPAAPATTDIKNQYESVSSNASAVATDTHTVTTVDSNAAAAAAASSITYNVGVNGTGQRKDYSVQTADGTAAAAGAAATTISVSSNAEPKKATQLLQYPKKVPPAPAQSTTTETPLIDDVDVSEDVIEKETKNHNLTIRDDYHDYYNSSLYVSKEEAQSLWQLVRNISKNQMLSSAHRRAMTVELTFDFPFYGYYVRNITVATGGFLYTGEYVHSWLAATQYIAPLMANFDTGMSDDSFVRVKDNGTAFTVVWENVSLQDKPEFGKFSFSTTLYKSGNIVFAYYHVPMPINAIQDNQHPVKVGLSDAYIIDKFLYFARRKTIYEYHRVTFDQQEILNATIIQLTALPTCLGYTDCQSCITHKTSFECSWCPILNRCSTGTDRKKQEWLQKGCDRAAISTIGACPALGQKGNNASAQDSNGSGASNTGGSAGAAQGGSSTTSAAAAAASSSSSAATTPSTPHAGDGTLSSTQQTPTDAAANGKVSERLDAERSAAASAETKSVGVAFGFLVPICLVFVVTLWLFYAYRNPHTKSGQLLIQFRPSQWSWRRGEARYTAATIHM